MRVAHERWNRKQWFTNSWWCVVILGTLLGRGAGRLGAETIGIDNARYRVEIDRTNGVITRIVDRMGKLDLLQEIRLADNFKFTLPLPGKAAWQATEANYILGKDQRLASGEKTDSRLILRWGAPLTSVLGRSYDVSAVMTIQLVGEDIRFGFRVENRTLCEIGEVFYPILGGSLGLGERAGDRRETQLVVPVGAGVESSRIYHTFSNFSWLGVIGPEQFYSYPDRLSMPWVELYQPGLGHAVYLAAHDPVARFKVFHLEMFPGIAADRADGNWPRPEELGDLPAGVKISLVHMPYERPDKTFVASPVTLRFHDGGWRQAARIYREWFGSKFDLESSRDGWMYREPAFQDCRGVPYRDLPEWAEQGRASASGSCCSATGRLAGTRTGSPASNPIRNSEPGTSLPRRS